MAVGASFILKSASFVYVYLHVYVYVYVSVCMYACWSADLKESCSGFVYISTLFVHESFRFLSP